MAVKFIFNLKEPQSEESLIMLICRWDSQPIKRIKKELEVDLKRINKIVKDEKGCFIFAMNEDRSILKDYYPICKNIDVDSGRRLVDKNDLCKKLEVLLVA